MVETSQALTGRMKALPKRCEAMMGFSGPEVSPGIAASAQWCAGERQAEQAVGGTWLRGSQCFSP